MPPMKFLVSFLLAFSIQSSLAAGPWDGIYQTGPMDYLSVHQNGNTVIVGQFSTAPPLGAFVNIGDDSASSRSVQMFGICYRES